VRLGYPVVCNPAAMPLMMWHTTSRSASCCDMGGLTPLVYSLAPTSSLFRMSALFANEMDRPTLLGAQDLQRAHVRWPPGDQDRAQQSEQHRHRYHARHEPGVEG
jgi:hypothetical protein